MKHRERQDRKRCRKTAYCLALSTAYHYSCSILLVVLSILLYIIDKLDLQFKDLWVGTACVYRAQQYMWLRHHCSSWNEPLMGKGKECIKPMEISTCHKSAFPRDDVKPLLV